MTERKLKDYEWGTDREMAQWEKLNLPKPLRAIFVDIDNPTRGRYFYMGEWEPNDPQYYCPDIWADKPTFHKAS